MRIALIYNHQPQQPDYRSGESIAETSVAEAVAAVTAALTELGHRVETVPLPGPESAVADRLGAVNADLLFNLFEGFTGQPRSEASVTALLRATGIPVTGCPPEALALTLDKPATHRILETAGLNVPRHRLVGANDTAGFAPAFPCIIKPPADDASHSLSAASVAAGPEGLGYALAALAERYPDTPALVEEFLDGREFNAAVMGNGAPRVLAVSEIVYTLPPEYPRILSFAAKWEPDSIYYRHTAVQCPAQVDAALDHALRYAALTAFRVTGCRGYARMDFRLDPAGHPVILEVNANPDLSPGAGVARQAEAAGLGYRKLIAAILELALEEN